MTETVLEFLEVWKTYPGPNEVRAINGITFSLSVGTFAALVGPSGSGKTTILNLASGLDRPTQGSVFLDGVEISRLSQNELCIFRQKKVGFVFQGYNLFPSLTALENVEFTSTIRGDSRAEVRRKAMDAVSTVGLSHKAHTFPGKLSGGEQQRIAVARALAAQPSIVFADEPTANLDSNTAFQLIDLFEKINQERGISFIFSTHDQRLLSRVKTQLQIQDGRLTEVPLV